VHRSRPWHEPAHLAMFRLMRSVPRSATTLIGSLGLACLSLTGCATEDPTVSSERYAELSAAVYCNAAFSCPCDAYPYDSVNECFDDLYGAYSDLLNQAALVGMNYDGSCPQDQLAAIEDLDCKAYVAPPPAGVCIPPCKPFYGPLQAGFSCEPVATSAELGQSYSLCAQGLSCIGGVCVNPCNAAGALPAIGEPCPDQLCEAGAMCDPNTETCVAAQTLPGAGQPCVNGQCNPLTAVCVPEANTCAVLPGTGQNCIQGQCDVNSVCDPVDDVCIAKPPLACGLLGGGVPGDGDGDPTGDGDGDMTGDGDGDPGGELSHALDIQPIWDNNCTTGCHSSGGVAEFLDLSGDAYADIVGVPSTQIDMLLVDPIAPEQSYLLLKLIGVHLDVGGTGGSMPAGAEPLPDDTIMMIEAWITAGVLP